MPSPEKNSDHSDSPELATLIKDWGHLPAITQAKLLKPLIVSGHSMRSLARQLLVSEATVRRRMKVADLPPEARAALETGRTSIRQALRDVRVTRTGREKVTREPTSKGGALEEAYQLVKNWLCEEEMLLAVDQLAVLKFLSRQAWIQTQVTPAEGVTGRAAGRSREDLKKLIQQYRPVRTNSALVTDVINHMIEWFSRWGPRAIPDPGIRHAVLARLAGELERP